MLTLALYALLAVAVMAAVFFVVASVLPAGEQIAPPIRDERLWELPADQAIGAEEVAAVRLPVALRGYRFAETDQLLDRLGEELRAREETIARLRAQLGGEPQDVEPQDVEAGVPQDVEAGVPQDVEAGVPQDVAAVEPQDVAAGEPVPDGD